MQLQVARDECGCVQGVMQADTLDIVHSYMLTQGNPRELRSAGQLISYLPSTVMYKDRR